MAFFSHGEGRHKLMILFFLETLNFEITRSELFRVFAEQDWMEYFDFQTALTQLEEDAFVAAVPCAFGQGYRVTPHGEETLRMFREELPHSVREQIRLYIEEHGQEFREQAQYEAHQTQKPDGSYLALFRLMDKSTQILRISLQLPDAQLAQAACDAWPDKAEAVYQLLLHTLFEEKKEGD